MDIWNLELFRLYMASWILGSKSYLASCLSCSCYIIHLLKVNVAGSTEAPVPADGTYRISHYPTFTYILQYFNVWADVTIPAGWSGGLETEFWYAETDTYEASPPKPTFTSNTAWIDGFF